MAAFVLIDIDVTEPVGYDEYKKLAPEAVAAYGGKYLARGGKVEVLEGSWTPRRLVILQFDTVDRAKHWLASQEYSAAKQLRHRTASSNMIVVEGA